MNKTNKKLQAIHNELNEIKEYKEKLKTIGNITKNEKQIFKQIITSKGEMDKIVKEELKKERKIIKNSWFDWFDWFFLNTMNK